MSMVFSAQNGKIGFNKGFLNLIKPEDFDKINKAIQLYNQRVNSASGNQAIFAESMKRLNPQLRNYLVGLNGANASMKGYGVHLVGATIKTVALQAASMALNAALTWGVSLAIQGIIAGVQALWKLVPTTEHLKKSLEETAQALSDIRSEKESLNDELKTTEERIAELEAKGTLSFTDEAELNRLNKENAALKTKIELLDIEAKKTREKNQNNFNKLIDKEETNTSNKSWTSVDYNGNSEQYKNITDKEKLLELAEIYDKVAKSKEDYLDVRGFSHSIEDVEKEITDFSSVVQEYQGYLDDLYQDGFDYNSADEATKQNIDYANEIIDRYMVLVGKTDTVWERAYNSDRFSEARTAIEELANAGNLTAESLQNLYNQGGNVKEFIDYMLSLNTVDWKTMLGDKFTDVAGEDGIVSLDEALKAMSDDTALASKIMGLFSNELNKVEDAADEAESSFKSIAKTLSDGLDKLSNKKDILSEVKEQLDSFGAISADNISKILERFPDNDDVQKAVAYYLSGLGTAQQVYDAMAKGYKNDLKLQGEKLNTQLQNDENYFNSLEKLHGDFRNFKVGNYKIDISDCKNLAEAKLKIETQLISELSKKWSKYWKATNTSLEATYAEVNRQYHIRENRGRLTDDFIKYYREVVSLYKSSKDGYSEFNKLAKNIFNTSPLTKDFDTKPGSETNKTAEEKIKNLKHRHEMGLISEKKYYEELEKIRKRYYAGKKKYLDRDRELQEEYHDWEVKNAEDGFEKKVEALQKKYVDGKLTYSQLKSAIKKLVNTTFKNDKDTKNEYIKKIPDYLKDAVDDKTDKNEDGFEKKVEELQKKYVDGKISYNKLRSDITSKINTAFKDDKDTKNEYLDKLSDYLKDAVEQFNQKQQDNFDTERSNLKHRLEMGEITEATYYKELKKIRDKYAKLNSKDLKDDIENLDKELHDYDVEKAEKSFESKLKIFQENYANGKYSDATFKTQVTNAIKSLFKNDLQKQEELLEELNNYLEEAKELKDEKNREDFDLSYDKLKYLLENGFITEATYYKNLDALYKKHYGNKTKYLDEYSQYSQEVYDGFKDMYKKDLEADKKALEEKKKAITEYYDELIEKIQDTHDEEDYEKEQSKKRKEIFDIDMQIAELMRDGSEKAKARIAELEEERLKAEEEYRDFETDKAREDEIERLEKEKEAREKEVQEKIDSIDTKLDSLDTNTKDIRNAVIQYAKAKGVDIKFAYASGTRSSVGGFGRINEKGIEMIASPDGNGNYVNLMPSSYVFSAKATEFLWKLATEHSLPQAMYNSIAKSIKTQSSTPSVNIAQPITITMGDIIIKGNADKQTVADIKKEQENTVRMVLQKIKELQK